ncbi:hypothetical protein BJ138DRAFT_1132080 [Hygrophoropsis aurantiaca]|uniref:Uncharacterized protein n=1 Tax=Hygrophoropsis aurantiaca TaxID=72124 RepID=A0ACB8AU45_9AGAM|nr:hypothetical protein BJ138DRAFT_1132080 [Hygrophoropsis aurantiaca]
MTSVVDSYLEPFVQFPPCFQGLEPRVTCLIDGDGTIFSPDLIILGQEGGFAAAGKLREEVEATFTNESFQFWVYLFYNKRGLLDTFSRAGLVLAKQKFEEFMMGFNQAAKRFVMVDVGGSKEAADAKLIVYLEDNIRLPQTRKIIFGGCHDNGYANTLRSVITAGFEDKLVLLPGYTEIANDIKALNLPVLRVPELFMSEKLVVGQNPSSFTTVGLAPSNINVPLAVSSPPAVPPGLGYASALTSTPARRASIQSYKSAAQGVSFGLARHTSPPLDTNGSSLSSENSDPPIPHPGFKSPAPCTLFYLAECRFGSDCKYGHDYLLNEDHYKELRENAKKVPCRAANEGEICTFGEECVYGHMCSQGTKCRFLKQGICKFVGAGMHRDAN